MPGPLARAKMLPDKLLFFLPRIAMCNQSINRRCACAPDLTSPIPPYSLVGDVVFCNSWPMLATVYALDYLAECNTSGAVALPFLYTLPVLPSLIMRCCHRGVSLAACVLMENMHPGA